MVHIGLSGTIYLDAKSVVSETIQMEEMVILPGIPCQMFQKKLKELMSTKLW